MTENPTPNDDDAILARAAEIQADRARAAALETVSQFEPLLDVLASPAWEEVLRKLTEIAPALATYPPVYMTLSELLGHMDALAVSTRVACEAEVGLSA